MCRNGFRVRFRWKNLSTGGVGRLSVSDKVRCAAVLTVPTPHVHHLHSIVYRTAKGA
jgi:hypothetical protein